MLASQLLAASASAEVAEHAGHGGMMMSSAGPDPAMPAPAPSLLDLEEMRNASGTAWQPAATPHAALHAKAAGFDLMLHGLLFGAYAAETSNRGNNEPFGVGWIMGMASRRLGTSTVTARVMLSPEPWSAGYRNGGYPLPLQTGESFHGEPLHDRQHPHDLFMETALLYTQELGTEVALQLYAAPAGEPALGPVAFPHRASAVSLPLATLSHHWQDSAHISFGVVSLGLLTRFAKLEASWFNGREPDERREDFDLAKPDSYAVRLSLAPGAAWSGQVSYGHLKAPEQLRPDVSVHRITASLMHGRAFGAQGHWASSAIFGANKEKGESLSPSFLVETNLDLDGVNTVFGRAELVQKSGFDLVLAPSLDDTHLWLGSLALGYLRNFGPVAHVLPGLGVMGEVDEVPGTVEPYYGTRWPLVGLLFLRIAVAPMHHG